MIKNWFTAIALLMSATQAFAAEGVVERIGRAVDSRSGEFLYEEHHSVTLNAGVIVTDEVSYRDAQGRVFASKRVDFSNNATMPAFALNNDRTGHSEALQLIDSGNVEVRFRENSAKPLKKVRLTPPPAAVADAGFDRFIEQNWDALLSNQTLILPFLVPGELEFINFHIRRAQGVDNNALKDAADTVRFELEIDSVLLRLLVPTLTVVYERATRRLLRYEGLSNLRGENSDNLAVHIDFRYPQHTANALR